MHVCPTKIFFKGEGLKFLPKVLEQKPSVMNATFYIPLCTPKECRGVLMKLECRGGRLYLKNPACIKPCIKWYASNVKKWRKKKGKLPLLFFLLLDKWYCTTWLISAKRRLIDVYTGRRYGREARHGKRGVPTSTLTLIVVYRCSLFTRSFLLNLKKNKKRDNKSRTFKLKLHCSLLDFNFWFSYQDNKLMVSY